MPTLPACQPSGPPRFLDGTENGLAPLTLEEWQRSRSKRMPRAIFGDLARSRSVSDSLAGAGASHLAGVKRIDRAINLGAINAPIPPKDRDSVLPRKEVIQPHLPVRLP